MCVGRCVGATRQRKTVLLVQGGARAGGAVLVQQRAGTMRKQADEREVATSGQAAEPSDNGAVACTPRLPQLWYNAVIIGSHASYKRGTSHSAPAWAPERRALALVTCSNCEEEMPPGICCSSCHNRVVVALLEQPRRQALLPQAAHISTGHCRRAERKLLLCLPALRIAELRAQPGARTATA